MTADSELKLCYVDGNWAYFTTQDVEKQWGDDWDDAPYEHNAEPPYESQDEEWVIERVAFESELVPPCEYHLNSPWSVQDINSKKTAWLRSPRWVEESIAEIFAGTRLDHFIEIMRILGGKVYREVK